MPAVADATTFQFPSTGLTGITFTIPKNLPDGQYLLRAEHIALHSASSFGGAQFYLGCAQVEVTGGGKLLLLLRIIPSTNVSFRCHRKRNSWHGLLVANFDQEANYYILIGPLVSIPGVYTGNEPGILINIYYPIPTSYTQPGPAVWSG
ncbi:hypothetical protein MPER_08065 [Moniliophthora perniciosa FA553]|nr:hypothetical protein MPER_08065 [Moniliophthora perniciosa FA553]